MRFSEGDIVRFSNVGRDVYGASGDHLTFRLRIDSQTRCGPVANSDPLRADLRSRQLQTDWPDCEQIFPPSRLLTIISIIGSSDIKIRPLPAKRTLEEKVRSVHEWIIKSVAPSLRRLGLYYGDYEWLYSQLDFSKCKFDDYIKYCPSFGEIYGDPADSDVDHSPSEGEHFQYSYQGDILCLPY